LAPQSHGVRLTDGLQKPPTCNPVESAKFDLNAKLAASLPLVRAALSAAIQNLRAVITSGPGTPGPAALAEDRLNRHFRLNTVDASRQSEAA